MLGSVLAVRAGLELGKVAVIVALHLQVEHLALARTGRGNQVLVKQSQDAATYVAQLVFYLQTTIPRWLLKASWVKPGSVCRSQLPLGQNQWV